jgi:hypothetical protein
MVHEKVSLKPHKLRLARHEEEKKRISLVFFMFDK